MTRHAASTDAAPQPAGPYSPCSRLPARRWTTSCVPGSSSPTPGHFEAMNAVYAEAFARPFPARTTMYLGLPSGMLMEIDALAVVG